MNYKELSLKRIGQDAVKQYDNDFKDLYNSLINVKSYEELISISEAVENLYQEMSLFMTFYNIQDTIER